MRLSSFLSALLISSACAGHAMADIHAAAQFSDLSFSLRDLNPADGIYYQSALVGNVTAVPEPSTYGMLLGGLTLLGVAARRAGRTGGHDA